MEIPAKKSSSLPFSKVFKVVAVLTAVTIIAVLWLTSQKSAVAVSFVVKESQLGDKVQGYGYLRPANEFSIMPTVQGVLVEKLVRPGDRVKKGDVLLKMQNVEIQQAFVSAELEVLSARASEKEAISKISQQTRQLKNAYQLAAAELELANAKLAANKKLFIKKIVSEIDLQQVTIETRQANLQYQAKKEELEDVVSLREAKMAVAQAQLNKAEASLSVAKSKFDALTIKASSDGIVQSLNSDLLIGNLVNAGVGLGSIADTDELFAELKVMANYASFLDLGQPVVLDVKGKTIQGTISHIEPNVVDNQVKILVDVNDLPDTARLNIEVTGFIETSQRVGLTIDRPAFVTGQEEFLTVERRGSDGSFEEQVVRLGSISKENIEILEGVQVNDEIKIRIPDNS